jgi:hypothetical protein
VIAGRASRGSGFCVSQKMVDGVKRDYNVGAGLLC